MTGFRATYRLQLGGDFGFAAARELVPYLADLGVSHLYLPPSFQARPGSTHGYDVVDPTSISEELGGEAEFRALVDAAHEAGLGVILDIVPNHMAVDDANRYWTEQRAKFFDVDAETGLVPALLRHRPPRRACARRTRRCSRRRTAWRSRSCARASVDGLRIDHPDGLADPAGYLERLRDAGVEHVWVEKILDPGETLRRLAGRGDGRLRVPQRRRGAVRRPGRRGAADRALARALRRRRARSPTYADEAKLRAGDDDVRRGGGAPRAQLPDRDDLPEALASLPVYRTYIRDGHASRRGPRGARRGRHRVAARRAARVRHALPADDAAGDGQGRRGHRLLPLPAPARAQRRRRRPGALRALGRGVPRRQRRAPARATCSSPRPTTPSARATCGRGSARWPGWPSSGRRTCAAGSS